LRTPATTALTFAALLSASLAASAQTDQPTVHHYHHVHHHHHYIAHGPAPERAAARPGEAVETPPTATNQMFRPYAQPGEGDNDGLSRDPDDCMKGCIGGNPQ